MHALLAAVEISLVAMLALALVAGITRFGRG